MLASSTTRRWRCPELLRSFSSIWTGDLCYYWRVAVNNQQPGPKISWRGPATVVMVEHEPHEELWLVHGTTMLRASPEHVKPVLSTDPSTSNIAINQPLQRAQLSLQQAEESPSMWTSQRPTRDPEKKWKQKMRRMTLILLQCLSPAVLVVIPGVFPLMDKFGRGFIGRPETTSTSHWQPTKLLFTSFFQLGQLRLPDRNLLLQLSSKMIGHGISMDWVDNLLPSGSR